MRMETPDENTAKSMIQFNLHSIITKMATDHQDEQTPLTLALINGSDDNIIQEIIDRTPALVNTKDQKSGLLPIEIATKTRQAVSLVYRLLLRDLHSDADEIEPNNCLAWFHIISDTSNNYYSLVQDLLKKCSQCQTFALVHAEHVTGRTAIEMATPICQHIMRSALRIYGVIEIIDSNPAFVNPLNETKMFYGMHFSDTLDNELTSESSGIMPEEKKFLMEKGTHVVVKVSASNEVRDREVLIRRDFQLSHKHIPAIISVHSRNENDTSARYDGTAGHFVCMECADSTLENMLVNLRARGYNLPFKELRKIGMGLLHLHEHGLVHGDFGAHNIGKFGDRYKVLGIGGAVPIGEMTDESRGYFLPPEAIAMPSRRRQLFKKNASAKVKSVISHPTFDIWAFAVLMYEVLSGKPMGVFAKGPLQNQVDLVSLGRLRTKDIGTMVKGLKSQHPLAVDLLKKMLHPNPSKRLNSMNEVLMHNVFAILPNVRAPSREMSSSDLCWESYDDIAHTIKDAPVDLNNTFKYGRTHYPIQERIQAETFGHLSSPSKETNVVVSCDKTQNSGTAIEKEAHVESISDTIPSQRNESLRWPKRGSIQQAPRDGPWETSSSIYNFDEDEFNEPHHASISEGDTIYKHIEAGDEETDYSDHDEFLTSFEPEFSWDGSFPSISRRNFPPEHFNSASSTEHKDILQISNTMISTKSSFPIQGLKCEQQEHRPESVSFWESWSSSSTGSRSLIDHDILSNADGQDELSMIFESDDSDASSTNLDCKSRQIVPLYPIIYDDETSCFDTVGSELNCESSHGSNGVNEELPAFLMIDVNEHADR